MDKKIVIFLKTYKVHILATLAFFFFLRSCSKSREISRLERANKKIEYVADSLQTRVESLKEDKIAIHVWYDNWISKKDRGSQLMELHSVVKHNIDSLQRSKH
jgi:hypothetical protein